VCDVDDALHVLSSRHWNTGSLFASGGIEYWSYSSLRDFLAVNKMGNCLHDYSFRYPNLPSDTRGDINVEP